MPIPAGGSQNTTTLPINFIDLYTEVLNRMRQPTGVTAITEQAKRYINTALNDLAIGFEYKLPWLERDAILRTRGPYTTGTVAATVGSTTLTGTSTVWTTTDSYGLANARTIGKVTLGDSNIYNITAVAASTLTLATGYTADSDLAAGASYTYFEDEYALATDFLKPLDYRMFSAALNIPIIGRDEFKRKFPRPNIGGKPKVCTIRDKVFASSTTPVIYIQFYPYPNDEYLIPYSYVTANLAVSSAGVEATAMSADTDEPNLPLRYRQALVLHAIAQWYRDKKDDQRGTFAVQEYENFVSRIVNDQRIGTNAQTRIQPRVGYYTGFARSPYGGRARGRRYSTNNSFDDFRD